MNKIEKKEIEDLVDKRLAKAVKERLSPLQNDITKLQGELAAYEGKFKGIEMDLKGRAKAFDEFMQDMAQKKGADEYQGIIDAIDGLAHAIQTQPVSTTTPTSPITDYDDLPWALMKNKRGYWLWSDKSEGLAERIHQRGGKLTEGGYDYGLYGDIHEALGIKKCVSRYTAKKKT